MDGEKPTYMPEEPRPVGFRERVLIYVLLAASALLLWLGYLLLRPFLPALAWALALAIVSYPLYVRIQGWSRNDSIAAGIAVALVAVVVVTPAIFIGQQIADQLASTIENFQAGAFEEKLAETVRRNPTTARIYQWLEPRMNFGEALSQSATTIGQQVTGILTGSVAGVMGLLITFFFLFYFLRDGKVATGKIRGVLPLSRNESDSLFGRIFDTIHATVFGTLAISAVQGTLGGLMFWWLGLPAPLLWGVVMGLLAVVPVLGAFVIWIPAAIYLAVYGFWGKAFLLSVWGVVVIGLIDNVLYPFLVGRKLQLHTVPVFIAILGGLLLFGASGIILGPVILALNLAALEVWRARSKQARLVEKTDGGETTLF